jgi:hypothetical protein
LDSIRDHIQGKSVFIPRNLVPYAKSALLEFDELEKMFMNIQTDFSPSGLRFGQVIVPNISYEIRPHAGPG